MKLFAAGAVTCAFVLSVPVVATGASGARPLTVGIIEPPQAATADAGAAFRKIRAAGITAVRTSLSWYSTAPIRRPSKWNPANPADRHYRWAQADARVRRIVAAGLTPIIAINDSPTWARVYPANNESPPDAADFGAFVHAAALRYSGKTRGLPRVQYWQIWIEPNLTPFFTPQFDPVTKQFVSPSRYRAIVNAAYFAIHRAVRSDVVIAGATAPFRDVTPAVMAVDSDWGPLKFVRRVFCLSDTQPLHSTCSATVHFDIWSTHPYTSGGPTHKAILPYDISLGNLPEWRATVQTAMRLGHARTTSGRLRLWATEFSWDSNPPDPCAPSTTLLERWVPEALYRMWANGIDLAVWLQLQDDPLKTSYYQSGLYFHAAHFAAAKPKPYLEGVRFPFVALRRGKGLYVWARTPGARPGVVAVAQRLGTTWQTVAHIRATAVGIAQAHLGVKPAGALRATFAGETSLPFAVQAPPDRFFNPFGQPTLLEPSKTPACAQGTGH